MKLFVASLRCPNDHVIAALAAKVADEHAPWLEDVLQLSFNQLVESGRVKNFCSICLSAELQIKVEEIDIDAEEAAEAAALTDDQRRQQRTGEHFWRSRN